MSAVGPLLRWHNGLVLSYQSRQRKANSCFDFSGRKTSEAVVLSVGQ